MLRKSRNISQVELAEGICTQAQISKIEKGEVYPLATTLYAIANRLGIDVNFFFNIGDSPRLDYITNVTSSIRDFIRRRDYHAVAEIIRVEKKNPLFTIRKYKQFLIWHEGICVYYLKNNREKSLQLLNKALSLAPTTDKNYSERELEILNSMGIIYFEEEQYQEANHYFHKAIHHFQKTPQSDLSIFIRIYYNLAKSLTRLSSYEESNNYCEKAIRLCLTNGIMYLLGELLYHKGYNFSCLGRTEEAISFMKKSVPIFELQENTAFIHAIEEKITQLH